MVQAWYGRWKVFDAETYQCFWERKTAVQFALFNINKTKQSVKKIFVGGGCAWVGSSSKKREQWIFNFKYFINPMYRIQGKITVNTEQQLQDIWPMD